MIEIKKLLIVWNYCCYKYFLDFQRTILRIELFLFIWILKNFNLFGIYLIFSRLKKNINIKSKMKYIVNSLFPIALQYNKTFEKISMAW